MTSWQPLSIGTVRGFPRWSVQYPSQRDSAGWAQIDPVRSASAAYQVSFERGLRSARGTGSRRGGCKNVARFGAASSATRSPVSARHYPDDER
jgi:hypothetical protein